MRKAGIILSFIVLFSTNSFSTPLVVNYFQKDLRFELEIKLLELALKETIDTDGEFSLRPIKEKVTQGRGLKFLEQGEIDVVFLPTSKERELQFLPIKIPLLRGILGYRIFLIHKDSINDFDEISTFEQLRKKYIAGFGTHWADRDILEDNNIRVMESPNYDNLFNMLELKRFDYFPRGITEVWRELEEFGTQHPNLIVEKQIALYYPYSVYYFVNKSNVKLAGRIERGLKVLLKNGSFKKLFFKYYAPYIKQANLENRKLFRIKNTVDPLNDPDTSWWLQEQ